MRRTTMLSVAFGALALSMGAAAADEIKIGVLAPLTGPSASDGEEYVRGVTWAVEEANAKGGVAGHTFKVEVADVGDQSAANVTSATERLLGTKGVEVILTGYASLSMFEVDLMAEANMPYLSAGPSPLFAAIVSKNPDALFLLLVLHGGLHRLRHRRSAHGGGLRQGGRDHSEEQESGDHLLRQSLFQGDIGRHEAALQGGGLDDHGR